MKKIGKILAASLAATMLMSTLALSACDIGGARELSSIVVTNGSVSTSYVLNETVSFDDIIITANYNDASTENVKLDSVKVYLNEEDITDNLNKITESVGTKTVTIEYAGKKAVLTITVSSIGGNGGNDGGGDTTPQTVLVAGYEAPGSYTTHLSQKNKAGKTAYGTAGYEAEFTTGTDMYTVGDDNAFKFLPTLRFLNANDEPETASAFASQTVISLHNGTEYTALESRAGTEENTVEYFDGDTVYVTAYTNNNRYDFTEAAIQKQFKLSVLPASNYVYAAGTPVACEVTVVDGFNVYTAKDLAVIDNDPNRTFWADIKTAEGLTGVNPAAVIFQNDITVTANDIPAAIQYTLDQKVTYYKDTDATTKKDPITGSSTFLYDRSTENDGSHATNVISRVLGDGQSFKIYGNYFNLDLSQMPLVCSFANEYEDGYGSDYSNAQFLMVTGNGTHTSTSETPSTASFEMDNLNVKGNANIASHVYVTSDGKTLPVYAGGLIFIKMEGINATLDNILTRTNFITFFPEGSNANITLKNTKCYDSYQNAVFVWAKNKLALENCNFERAGGPLIIAQHKDPDKDSTDYSTITADDNTVFKNLVTGQEFWFGTVGAASAVTQLKGLNALFLGYHQKSILNENSDNGKFNMICLVMNNGRNADAITTQGVQGSFSYKEETLDRIATGTGTMGDFVQGYLKKVYDATESFGVCFNAGGSFGYMAGETTPDEGFATANGFKTSDYIVINLGAFGLFLEYFTLAQ